MFLLLFEIKENGIIMSAHKKGFRRRGFIICRVTVPFTRKPQLAKILYLYYDWFRSLN